MTFHGQHHDIDDLGLGQLPVTPIPLWVGCSAREPLLRRVAALADGWLPPLGLGEADPARSIQGFTRAIGRRSPIGVAGRVVAGAPPDDTVARAQEQLDRGATEITLSAPPAATLADGVRALVEARAALSARLAPT